MKNDNEATIWVLTLGRRQVTRAQKQVLLRIADHWSTRFRAAVISSDDLCDELLITRRHLRRVLADIAGAGLIDYIPGLGAGNYSQFSFPQLADRPAVKGDAKGTQRGHFEQRNKERNLNPSQKQIPLNPPAGAGGLIAAPAPAVFPRLTQRRLKEFNALLYQLTARQVIGQDGLSVAIKPICEEFADAVELACARLLIPLDLAWSIVSACGMGDARKPVKTAARDRAG